MKFDAAKLEGAPGKLMNVSRLKSLGWNLFSDVRGGLAMACQWFLENQVKFRGWLFLVTPCVFIKVI
jgi:nucleoside-diphosphate-sugar epimerase